MAITFLTNDDEKKYVRSVNGKGPDENGNVVVETGGGSDGMSVTAAKLLCTYLWNCATHDNLTATLYALEAALGLPETPDEGVTESDGMITIVSGVTCGEDGSTLEIE